MTTEANAVDLARLEEKHLALALLLANHEKTCADRYGLILKVVIGSAGTTIVGLGAIVLMLFEKII
jgi:hypothetical protein